MSRLWSPVGDVTDRQPPFGVWVGEPTFPARPTAPPARALWRRSAALLLVAGTLATAMVAGSVVAMAVLGFGVGGFSAAMPQAILAVTPVTETASAMALIRLGGMRSGERGYPFMRFGSATPICARS